MKKRFLRIGTHSVALVYVATILSGCQSAQTMVSAPLTATMGFLDSTIGQPENKTHLHKLCESSFVADTLNLKISAAFTDTINQIAYDGDTPLHAALKSGKPPYFIKTLLDAKADPNILDSCGRNALHIALIKNHELETIQLLIDSGVDIKLGSPYELAILNESSKEVIELLISSGVEVKLDMLEVLNSKNWMRLCDNLPEEFLNPNTVHPITYSIYLKRSSNQLISDQLPLIDIAVISANLEQYQYFKAKGHKVSEKIQEKYNIIHFPIEKNGLELTKLLIQSGHDINFIDESGVSPLHLAAILGYEKMCKLLINQGADVNIKDQNGNTPLHFAINAKSAKCAILLLERGALPNQLNSEGESPLEIAVDCELDSIMPYLLSKIQNQKLSQTEL